MVPFNFFLLGPPAQPGPSAQLAPAPRRHARPTPAPATRPAPAVSQPNQHARQPHPTPRRRSSCQPAHRPTPAAATRTSASSRSTPAPTRASQLFFSSGPAARAAVQTAPPGARLHERPGDETPPHRQPGHSQPRASPRPGLSLRLRGGRLGAAARRHSVPLDRQAEEPEPPRAGSSRHCGGSRTFVCRTLHAPLLAASPSQPAPRCSRTLFFLPPDHQWGWPPHTPPSAQHPSRQPGCTGCHSGCTAPARASPSGPLARRAGILVPGPGLPVTTSAGPARDGTTCGRGDTSSACQPPQSRFKFQGKVVCFA